MATYNPNDALVLLNTALNADEFNGLKNKPYLVLWDQSKNALQLADTETGNVIKELFGDTGNIPYGNDIGAPNAYQVIIPDATLNQGYTFEMRVDLANTNTGASTLQVNALGIKAIVDSDGNPISSDMLVGGNIYLFVYNDFFDNYQLLGLAKPNTGAAIANLGNILFVSTNGDNSTAIKGRIDKPFSTLSQAQLAASAGDLIYVYPGTYGIVGALGKNLVDWYFSPGAVVNNSTTVFGGSSISYNIFGSGNFNQTGLFIGVPLFSFSGCTVNIQMNNGTSNSLAYGFLIADSQSKINVTFNIADCTVKDGDFITAYNGSVVNAYGNEARFRRIAIYTEQHNGKTTVVNCYVKKITALDAIADFTQFAPTYVFTNTGASEVNIYSNLNNEQTVDTPSVSSSILGSGATAPTIIRLFGELINARTLGGISPGANCTTFVKSDVKQAQGNAAEPLSGGTLYLDHNRMELTGASVRPAILVHVGSDLIMDGPIVIGNDAVNGSINMIGNPNIRVYATVFTNQPVVGAYTNIVAGTTIVTDANVI